MNQNELAACLTQEWAAAREASTRWKSHSVPCTQMHHYCPSTWLYSLLTTRFQGTKCPTRTLPGLKYYWFETCLYCVKMYYCIQLTKFPCIVVYICQHLDNMPLYKNVDKFLSDARFFSFLKLCPYSSKLVAINNIRPSLFQNMCPVGHTESSSMDAETPCGWFTS